MMNKIKYLGITLPFIIITTIASAQVAVGQWQDHFSYNNCKQLIIVDETIYLIAECGVIKYDSKSEEIERFNRFNVLSDITPSGIAYDEKTKSIIIGYSSGNIDIIRKNEIVNINDIKKKLMSSINVIKIVYMTKLEQLTNDRVSK